MSLNPVPARSIPPGRIIRKELEARGWTQADLARILGRPEQTISSIVRGRKQITPATGLGLANAFGTSAELWLGLETRYRLAEARKSDKDDQVRRRSTLYSTVPLRELIKRGWIDDTDDTQQLELEVTRFLGVPSLESVPPLRVAARRTTSKPADQRAVLAWVRRVEQLAAGQDVPRFDANRLDRAFATILQFSDSLEHVERVPRLLRDLGLRFVIVPHLPKTYLDGAVLAADGNPVVALTLRHDRLDNFWFTLLHELEHLARGHNGSWLECLDEEAAPDSEEDQADEGAAKRLVPTAEFQRFVNRVAPYFSKTKIEAFARAIGRHPAIVLGRLHHHGHVAPGHLRRMIPPVRKHLEPWIDTLA